MVGISITMGVWESITMVGISVSSIEGISRSLSISRSLAIMISMVSVWVSVVSMVGISMTIGIGESITIGTIVGISLSLWFGISFSSNSCEKAESGNGNGFHLYLCCKLEEIARLPM